MSDHASEVVVDQPNVVPMTMIAALPDHKEWDAEACDRGDTSSETYETADYVDGWNDALDAVMSCLRSAPVATLTAAEDAELAGHRALVARLETWIADMEQPGKSAIGWRVATGLRRHLSGEASSAPLDPAEDALELRRVRSIVGRLSHRNPEEWGDPLDGCLAALTRAIRLAGSE